MDIDSNEVQRRLIIVGTGGLARELHELIEDIQDAEAGARRSEVLGWLDSNPATHGTQVHGLPVLGDLEWIKDHPDVGVVVGIGAPSTRRKVVEQIRALGHTAFPTLSRSRIVFR